MKQSPLSEFHHALGAKMTEFAGYYMPLSYSTVQEEHAMVRNHCGIFDVSHMGEFIVKGKEALQLVQSVISNDASKLEMGQAQYAYFPNENGGIVDDLLVYRLFDDQCNEGEQAFMLVVNASNIEKDLAWIKSHNTFDTRIINISDQTGLIALQGPKAQQILSTYTDLDLDSIPYYHFKKGNCCDCPNILVSATGYTGSGGFEIYGTNEDIKKIWESLQSKFGDHFQPCGLGARDTLRLEMGYCLYGNDIGDSTSPFEAGLGWITKLKKDTPFVGRDILLKQKENGIVKKLVGFKVEDRRVPRPGYLIEDESGATIGEVTSGTFSPSLSYPIGMGYVQKSFSKEGSDIEINTGRKKLKATVVKLPFYRS